MTSQNARAISLGVASATVLTRNRCVTIGANGLAVLPSANGDVVGVALEDSANGEDYSVPVAVFDGSVVEIEAGGAITAGNAVKVTATGVVIAATGGVSDRNIGYALDGAASGEVIRVLASKTAGFAAQA